MWCQPGTQQPREYIRSFFLSFPHWAFIFHWHLGDLIIALVWGELQLHFLFPVALWSFYRSFSIRNIPEQPAELPVNIWVCICDQSNSLIPSFYLSPFVTKGFLFYSGTLWLCLVFVSLSAVIQLVWPCLAPSCLCKCHYVILCPISFLGLSQSPGPL